MSGIGLVFAIIGVLCSFGIVIMGLALAVFWHERRIPDTFGDGPPDANAVHLLCIFCGHGKHAPYLCRAAGAGACACAGDPGADDVAAAWARACADVEEHPGEHPMLRRDQKRSSSKGKGWNG